MPKINWRAFFIALGVMVLLVIMFETIYHWPWTVGLWALAGIGLMIYNFIDDDMKRKGKIQ